MQVLSIDEIQEVSGGGYGKTIGTIGLVSGGAALGSYYSAMYFGATIGAAAGPVGGLFGALVGGSIAYIYYTNFA
jgi:hypothetical protein